MGTIHQRLHKPLLPDLISVDGINLTDLEKALIQNVHARRGYKSIIVEKEFTGGYGGTRVFLVLPVKSVDEADARVVTKIGPKSELDGEKKNYKKFVKGALPFTATPVSGYYEQDNQAALNYVFAGDGNLGKTPSLEEYYQTHPAEKVKATLDGLLSKELGPKWYGQSKPLHRLFREEYGQHLPALEELERIVRVIFQNMSSAQDERINIPGLAEAPHPLKIYPVILNRTLNGGQSLVHGDLHPRNVLVDQSGKAWLIDFAKVIRRHNLFDFIKIETYLRLMVLAPAQAEFSWSDYVQFELALNDDTLGRKATPPANPTLAKAYTVIQTIRSVARKYMRPDSDFKTEYFPALFLYSLAMLKYYPAHGAVPTQLVFITAYSLTVDIFEEPKIVKPNSNEDQNRPKEEQTTQKGNNPNAGSGGNISIGGNANNNFIMSGDQNKINHTTRHINTGGGAYVKGDVNVQNGDFVGRDKTVDNRITIGDIIGNTGVAIGHGAKVNINQSSGASVDEIAAVFTLLFQRVDEMRNGPAKTIAKTAVQGLETEAKQGQQAVEENVGEWFGSLAHIAPDIWEVAVDTFANPIKGISTVFQKIAQRVKDERKKLSGS